MREQEYRHYFSGSIMQSSSVEVDKIIEGLDRQAFRTHKCMQNFKTKAMPYGYLTHTLSNDLNQPKPTTKLETCM
jgi:hypothetical protein